MVQLDLNNQETLQAAYEAVRNSIRYNQAYASKRAHAIIWNDYIFHRSDGAKVLETMLENERGEEKKKELQEELEYWNQHYNDIRKNVYQEN